MAMTTTWVRPAALFLAVAGAPACRNEIRSTDPPPAVISMRRAWLPGERAAKIQDIVTNRRFVFPYAGDVSDMAPAIYADPDSVTIMVANPALQPSVTGPPDASSLTLFSPAWDFVVLRITSVNNNTAPPDSLLWVMTLWKDPADAGSHGFAIAYSAAATFNIRPINTSIFDAAAGKSGAAAGEFHASTGTYWEDDGTGGRYQSTSLVFSGAFSPITTGPYLGGESRAGQAYGRFRTANFVRKVGAENPASFTIDFDYVGPPLPAVEIVCLFPTPCTTNGPLIAAHLARSARMGR